MPTLNRLIETSLANVINDVDVSEYLPNGITIYAGFGNDQTQAPCVLVDVDSMTDEAPNLGCFHCICKVDVGMMANEATPEMIDGVASKIFEAVTADTITASMQAKEPRLKVFGVFSLGMTKEFNGDAWFQALQLDVVASYP